MSAQVYILQIETIYSIEETWPAQTQIGRYFLLAVFLKEEKVKNSFYS